jgi:splicing factor U2AF subunit
MADYLASIFATEKDMVNCSFYFKIGACRHGLKCTKSHNKPTFSQTVLLKNFYLGPLNSPNLHLVNGGERKIYTEEDLQRHFDETYEELFIELESKYGELEELNIVENLNDHLIGNTYVKFRYEEDAEKAVDDLNNRWFDGKPIYAELSPVTDFTEASCQFRPVDCPRGKQCNFLHLKLISKELRYRLLKNRKRFSYRE